MSALLPKADIDRHDWHVRFVPKADKRTAAKFETTRRDLQFTPLPSVLHAEVALDAVATDAVVGVGAGN